MKINHVVMLTVGAFSLLAAAAGSGRAADAVKVGFSASKTGLFASASVTQTNA